MVAAQHDPDRSTVADDDGRQRVGSLNVTYRSPNPVRLLAQGLSAGEAEIVPRPAPSRIAVGKLAFDLEPKPPFPVSAIALSQASVEPWLEPQPRPEYLRGLSGSAQIGAPQRRDRLRLESLCELMRLPSPGLVQGGVTKALDPDRRDVVVCLAMASQEDRFAAAHSSGIAVSERSPSRIVSSDSTSSGRMLPRFTSGPKRRTNHTCWSLRGASNRIFSGATACAISSISPIRTSPSWRAIPTFPLSLASAITFQAPAWSSRSISSTHLYGAMILV